MDSLQVLVAEDDALESQQMVVMLSQAGFSVVGTASDGESAVDQALDKGPDIVLMDIKMPAIDGIEATRRIMENKPVPIIAVADEPDQESALEAADAGVMGYLVKPITPETLIPAVAIAIKRFRECNESRDELAHLKETLETRKFAEQAKGIIMQRLQLPESQAYAHLREKCRNQQKTMKQASIEIIEAEHHFLEMLAKEPPSRMRQFRPLEERAHT